MRRTLYHKMKQSIRVTARCVKEKHNVTEHIICKQTFTNNHYIRKSLSITHRDEGKRNSDSYYRNDKRNIHTCSPRLIMRFLT